MLQTIKQWLDFIGLIGIAIFGMIAAVQISWPLFPAPNYGLSAFVLIMAVHSVTSILLRRRDENQNKKLNL